MEQRACSSLLSNQSTTEPDSLDVGRDSKFEQSKNQNIETPTENSAGKGSEDKKSSRCILLKAALGNAGVRRRRPADPKISQMKKVAHQHYSVFNSTV